MFAVDLSNDVVIPQLVTLVGALVAGGSAVLRSWIENKDARARGDRKLELARQRTAFAREWIEISESLDAGRSVPPVSAVGIHELGRDDKRTQLRDQADKNLKEAVQEAERAFYEASADTSTALLQLRRLLMLVRRRNPASYVVTGLFLFLSVFVWLLVCIPAPGSDFSLVAAIAISIVATVALRVVAGVVVGALEQFVRRDSETIKEIAVRDNTVTLTTRGPHGLSRDEQPTVVIDASDDRFDGTFTVVPKTDTTFEFQLPRWMPDVESLDMRGWVCGDRVGQQIRRLFLIHGGRPHSVDLVVGALFVAAVVAFSVWAVSDARNDIDAEGYPFCQAQPYDGGYFGEYDPFLDTADAAVFLNEAAPLWAEPGSLPVGPVRLGTASGTLVAADGTEFVYDEVRLRFERGATVLYERTGDKRLEPIGDPCEPQPIPVEIDTFREGVIELFNFFDDSAGYGTGEEQQFIYQGDQKSGRQIQAYFGPDGRLIPVCDEVNYPEIQPCLEERNVDFDSGLDATITRAFWTGVMILSFAIGLRLVIWLLARLRATREQRPTEAADASNAGPA